MADKAPIVQWTVKCCEPVLSMSQVTKATAPTCAANTTLCCSAYAVLQCHIQVQQVPVARQGGSNLSTCLHGSLQERQDLRGHTHRKALCVSVISHPVWMTAALLQAVLVLKSEKHYDTALCSCQLHT